MSVCIMRLCRSRLVSGLLSIDPERAHLKTKCPPVHRGAGLIPSSLRNEQMVSERHLNYFFPFSVSAASSNTSCISLNLTSNSVQATSQTVRLPASCSPSEWRLMSEPQWCHRFLFFLKNHFPIIGLFVLYSLISHHNNTMSRKWNCLWSSKWLSGILIISHHHPWFASPLMRLVMGKILWTEYNTVMELVCQQWLIKEAKFRLGCGWLLEVWGGRNLFTYITCITLKLHRYKHSPKGAK